MRTLSFLLLATLVCVVVVNADTGECPNDCSGFGECSRGQCHCNPGYEEADCSRRVYSIEEDEVVADSIEKSNWLYYKFHNKHSKTSMVWWLNRTNDVGE